MSEPHDPAESFLQRWSRRKQSADARTPAAVKSDEARLDEAKPDGAEPDEGEPHAVPASLNRRDGGTGRPQPDDAGANSVVPPFDIASLPPIDSITAASDIRAFLAPGVPADLTRAALRRAWVTDPTIREFIGLAENQWDFNNPDSIPGFGTLEITDEIRRMVAGLVGTPPMPAGDASRSVAETSPEAPEQFPVELGEPGAIGCATSVGQDGTSAEPVAGEDDPSMIAGGPSALDPGPRDRDFIVPRNSAVEPAPESIAHRRHGGALPQ